MIMQICGDQHKGQDRKNRHPVEMARQEGIPTFGVGDGGNEIGMGNLKEVIMSKLALTPCDIEVDALIIATVSN